MWSRSVIPLISLSLLALPACAATPEPKAAASQSSSASPVAASPQTASTGLTQQERFNVWKSKFISQAVTKGYDRAMVERLILPAKIEERALERDKTQPEFSKPIWSYVDGAASATRLNGGRTKLAENRATFDAIEARYKVPRHILTSIWGLETAYGKIMGDYAPVNALATFAFEGRRKAFGENQLYALLDLLKSGSVRQDQLISSWAGAMGMTQFIPATFRDYAVDFDGDGNKDLWNNEADALGSAAHYLARHGWRWGEPVMTEVAVDEGFDYSLIEENKKSINEWTALGVRPIGGQRWSTEAGFLEAKLIAPGGHRGPKLLTFKNFDVIKKYNNSTSYAMGITVLGEALRGKSIIQTDWPRADKPLSFENKKAMQRKLNQLGFNVGGVDGVVGPGTRKGIRAWQKSRGFPADGYMEQTLFTRLMAQN
jgi:membrane-bound lytic murein transglycosylase B